MGTGEYKGGTVTYHSVGDNVSNTAKYYKYENGYFGDKAKKESIRHIYSNNIQSTAKDFYDKITYGGIEADIPNGNGMVTKLSDGTIVTWRNISSSDGSPAVDINIKYSKNSDGVKQQKIHFVKGD